MTHDAPNDNELLVLKVADEASGQTWRIAFDLAMAAAWLDIIRAKGVDYAHSLALGGVLMAGCEAPELRGQILRGVLETLEDAVAAFADQEDLLLAFSYERLRDKQMSRPQAADVASSILGRRVTPDAWRKAVDKWAHAQGLPKVDLVRGRPKKRKSEK